MISSFHVITAAHCVYDLDTDEWMEDMYVIPAQTDVESPVASSEASDDRPYGIAQVIEMTTWGYNGLASNVWSAHVDYALLRLDREIGDRSNWMGYSSSGVTLGGVLNQHGYPGWDFDGRFQYYRTGDVTRLDNADMDTDMDTCPGDSGSGIY
eukprot:TRINITY_DN4068_c0_g1_i1.p4 TRINITY_DN4068_c0_g1~~TRINITY_DN4068_c0_g1_i1.p4  ORF type:complete len:153 (+),score=23.22 TRINITY_DN4068_c0_g1_i1:1845-2303(+)